MVDVYTIPLEAETARLDYLFETLAPEERDRAHRFRFAGDRRHYIASRGNVREILSNYLKMEPSAIRFAYNQYGKPRLRESELIGSGLRFNLSHSGGWAMLAVTRGREVGIDIERVDPGFAEEQIPERFFSPREVSALRTLPAWEQTPAFFRCWTRKEAYIKARGMGLALELDSFDVTLGPEDQPALYRAGNWSIQNLEAPAGYAAAIVAEGGSFTVSGLTVSACDSLEVSALLPA